MTPPQRPPASGLFRRIYLTFVGTTIVFAVLIAITIYAASNRFDAAWVDSVDEDVDAAQAALLSHIKADDSDALDRDLAALADRHDLRFALRDPRGDLLAGDRTVPPPPRHHALRRLHNGKPIVRRRDRFGPPLIHWGLMEEGDRRIVALLTADAAEPGRPRWVLGGIALGLLLILGFGAWPLARSLVRRLAAVEDGALQIADGDLSHRLPLPSGGPKDEVDALAATFNRMAERLEGLVSGQRILLANVSHELRTPVARMRVLVEILEDRADILRERVSAERDEQIVDRLRRGLGELTDDLREIEALIGDLLTSGKLELAADGGVERGRIVVAELIERLGDRFAADYRAEPEELAIEGDAMLLERLLSNLLANARRACPDGALTIRAASDGGRVVITVEDEGPGIPPENREVIFEPFSRLDGARDRDAGGVGLGLYLCRQIAKAHGGTIITESRPDGRSGARFVISLPLPAASAES
ncbi:MAG: HAMP domain-containing histidine kinase [Myxococcales bacterium]|nr:HAMP domain-containing histidine kinase [Myxococcales bacterium]